MYEKSRISSISRLQIVLAFMLFITVGCSQTSSHGDDEGNKKFELTSAAFEHNGRIDINYTRSNGNNSIPLTWNTAPKGTKSLAVFMVDLHPIASNWVHWLVVDVPPKIALLEEAASGTDKLPKGSRELFNSFGTKGYGGPQPPAGSGDHEYKTIVYALNVKTLDVPDRITFADFQTLVEPYTIASTEISGFYENK